MFIRCVYAYFFLYGKIPFIKIIVGFKGYFKNKTYFQQNIIFNTKWKAIVLIMRDIGMWQKKKKAKNLVKNKITCSKKRRVVKSDTRS